MIKVDTVVDFSYISMCLLLYNAIQSLHTMFTPLNNNNKVDGNLTNANHIITNCIHIYIGSVPAVRLVFACLHQSNILHEVIQFCFTQKFISQV